MSASRELQRQLKRYEPCLPRPAKAPPAGPGSDVRGIEPATAHARRRDAKGVALQPQEL